MIFEKVKKETYEDISVFEIETGSILIPPPPPPPPPPPQIINSSMMKDIFEVTCNIYEQMEEMNYKRKIQCNLDAMKYEEDLKQMIINIAFFCNKRWLQCGLTKRVYVPTFEEGYNYELGVIEYLNIFQELLENGD